MTYMYIMHCTLHSNVLALAHLHLHLQVEFVIKVDMSAMQKRLYRTVKKFGVLMTDGGLNPPEKKEKNSGQALQNVIMQLKKICNHPFIFREVGVVACVCL